MSGLVACPSCGDAYPDLGLPAPADLRASGECRAASAERFAPFYAAPLVGHRQLVVDAYACTHPDAGTRKGAQATALSLMTLDLMLECGQPVADGSAMHHEMMRAGPPTFPALAAPSLAGVPTSRIVEGRSAGELPAIAREWAEAVWAAWSDHHGQVRAWNEQLVPQRVRG